MRWVYSLIAALVLPVPASKAQRAPLDVAVDYATFAFDEAESMVEIYFSVGAASLVYATVDSTFEARLPLNIGLWRASDAELQEPPQEAVWSHESELSFAVADTASLSEGQSFVRQMRVTVPAGEYELRVGVTPQGGQRLDATRDIIVPNLAKQTGCAFSDVTLASQIRRSSEREDPFYKNGLYILPNASQLYGTGATRLFYYAEAYNTDCAANASGQYTLLTYVAEANNAAPLAGLQRRAARTARPADVIVGSFRLGALGSGTYFLRMVILNEANEAVVEQSRKFFVFNPEQDQARQVAQQAVDVFETSAYASMPEEEVEKGFEHARVVATEQEKRRMRTLEDLDLDERRRFLMEFWQVRDPSPSTVANEFRDEFYSLLMYANERYSMRSQEGWRSDRGQVLIKYGRPTSIEPHLYDRGFKPYEIWKYNNIAGEGQAEFVFSDLNGFGEFELIHSTVAGERQLPNWIQEVSNTY